METKDIKIDKIRSFENIRQKEIGEGLADLMRSIKENGLLQPIGLKEESTGYLIIWGNRRLQACKKLGWKTIPAVIFSTLDDESMTEEQFFVLNATENLQRTPNSLLELGRICTFLRKSMSVSEISARLSLPKERIEGALLEHSRIPKKWQKKIRLFNSNEDKQGDIPMTTASIIARQRGLTPGQRDSLFEFVSKNDADSKEIVLIASLLKNKVSFADALKSLDKYTSRHVHLYFDKEKLEQALLEADVKTFSEWITQTLNTRIKDLVVNSTKQ